MELLLSIEYIGDLTTSTRGLQNQKYQGTLLHHDDEKDLIQIHSEYPATRNLDKMCIYNAGHGQCECVHQQRRTNL
jgi:hypothetical protein